MTVTDAKAESLRVIRRGANATVVLSGDFDHSAAAHLDDLIDWLLEQGPVHLEAEVVDEPDSPDGFALRRLFALARARRAIEARGGTLTVVAAPRLRRTLEAMRLHTPSAAMPA